MSDPMSPDASSLPMPKWSSSSQLVSSSGALTTPPDPQSYQMMYLASLPYFPLPATNDAQ